MTVLVDSSALIDLLTDGPFSDWVVEQMARFDDALFAINPLIYAEISIPYPSLAELDEDLDRFLFVRAQIPWDAAFAAGKAFRAYRGRGGQRTSPLPDFYIGAHAQVAGLTLLTRDSRRFRTYFPDVDIVAPN